MTAGTHAPGQSRIHRIARRLADARERASMAAATGDDSGYRYCMAEVRRLRSILAEGAR